MSPADLTGAAANIVTLEAEVTGGKNGSLVYGYNGTITSALRLHTRLSPTSDIAQVAAQKLNNMMCSFAGSRRVLATAVDDWSGKPYCVSS